MIGYTLDKDSRRTQAALSDGSRWEYGYDPLNQLTSAERADSDGAALNAMSYRYDGIGNRTAAEEDGEAFAYASNQLNQYTAVNGRELTYDADGNTLTTDDGWLYTWNSENRLIRAEKGSVKFEAGYDYMGRRFEKKLYDGETLTVHRKFVYDGYKLIGVYDALNNDAEELSFVWQPEAAGLDVPLSMKHDNAAYYYVTDGNKNVTALYDATGAEAANYVYGPFGQTLAANGRGGESPAAVDYEGGKVAAICNLLSGSSDEMHRPEDLDLDMLFCMELGGDSGIGGDGNASALRTVFGMEAMDRRQYDTSTTPPLPPGGLALVNPFRFSSEFHDDELGLVYYNYRYYNPQLGRWTKRDPIGETSGLNFYNFATNSIINKIDHLGLANYIVGTQLPEYIPDEGAGAWGSLMSTNDKEMVEAFEKLTVAILMATNFVKYRYPDAAAHLRYYFTNTTGTPYQIRMNEFMKTKAAQSVLNEELKDVKRLADKLPPNIYNITSTSHTEGYVEQDEDPNWYFAVGGFLGCGKGKLTIPSAQCYELEFTFYMIDKYNWDNGKSADLPIVGRVDDILMGTFHKLGFAREFLMYGIKKYKVRWDKNGNRTIEEMQ